MLSVRLFILLASLILAVAPAAAQGPKKVLHIAFRVAETGFDPQKVQDRYSVGVLENLFETLLTYDYLARPVKLVPGAAEAIPEPEEGGTRYTFRIRPGILYADDPVFKGQKRELVAADMVSWGTMLAEAQNELVIGKWWQLVAAGASMALLVTAFSLLTDSLRDALDPKLK